MTAATLSRAELSTQGAWLTLPGSASDGATYRALTGSSAPAPAGLAIVAARRAFTRGKALPPGGVLLGIDLRLGDWDPVSDGEFRCSAADRDDRKGRLIVAVRVELRSSGSGRAPTLVAFSLRWPTEAEPHG